MVGHLASDFAFLSPLALEAMAEPGWVDPWTWLSSLGPPGESGNGLGVGPGAKLWGEFPLWMAYCTSQVRVGLVPQGARVGNNSEGASPEPCAAPTGAAHGPSMVLQPSPEGQTMIR
uniref:Uncharacterized protein n=1 Tax=Catagonus wagneri TaxID=51154 RepID=A0A8C3YDN2_9CETA